MLGAGVKGMKEHSDLRDGSKRGLKQGKQSKKLCVKSRVGEGSALPGWVTRLVRGEAPKAEGAQHCWIKKRHHHGMRGRETQARALLQLLLAESAGGFTP